MQANMPALFVMQKQLRARINTATPVATPPGCVAFIYDPSAVTVNCHMTFRNREAWDNIMAMPATTDDEERIKRRAINDYYDNPRHRVIVSSAQNLLALSTPLSYDMRNIFETIYAVRDNIETIDPNDRHLLVEYTGRLLCLRAAPRFKVMPKAAIMWRSNANGELEHYAAPDMRILTEDLHHFLWENLEKDETRYPPQMRMDPGVLVDIINRVCF
jgi:hypothetical protein